MNKEIRMTLAAYLLMASVTAGTLAATAALTGCSRQDSAGDTIASESQVSTSASETKHVLEDKGTIGGIEYEVYNEGHVNGSGKRGYFIETLDQPDSPYYIIINAGEYASGGYDIRIVDLNIDDQGRFVITVDETSPAPGSEVTAVMTYPYCGLKVNKVPDKLKIVDSNGCEIARVDNKRVEITVDDGYIAILEGGAGEIMRKTYLYKTDSGYRYINVTATTVSYGSPQWKEVVNSAGEISSKDEIISIAKGHGSCGFVMIAGEDKPCTIEEFLKRDI